MKWGWTVIKVHDGSVGQLASRTRNLLALRAEAQRRDDELLRQARNRVRQSQLTLQRSAESLQMALVARAALASLLPRLPTS
jgi:hypothetical protein